MEFSEKMHILRQNRHGSWTRRIIAQMTYLEKIFASRAITPEPEFLKAVDYLYGCLTENGGIVKENVLNAEQLMEPLIPLAKQYTMYMAGHAHIDMNWCWDWSETVTATIDTFRTMLDLLREYPHFVFSQSQAATYAIIEEYAPYMLPEIQQRVSEGRWEVTASSWVEADQNMPDGESIAHHILYTKRYMNRLFGLKSEDLVIDFEPDTFGHNQNIPEFLSGGGIKYLYYCRGFASGHHLFKWKSESGASVIAYEDPLWYSAILEPEIMESCVDVCHSAKTNIMLKLYGIGDHGGGPSRRDIERIAEYASWPLAPKFELGTIRGFFERVEKEYGNDLPVIERDFNYVFQGCYSSQSRIKMANRLGQQRLYDAEVFNSFAALAGCDIFTDGIEKGWRRVLQNQFHDILPGSGVIDTREHAMGRFQEACAYANVAAKNALVSICNCIDTSAVAVDGVDAAYGSGAGEQAFRYGISCSERGQGKVRIYHLFNSTAYDFYGVHQIVVWSWPHDRARALVTDINGRELPSSVTAGDESWFYEHFTLNVEVSVPAFGYTTVILTERQSCVMRLTDGGAAQREGNQQEYVLENSSIRAEFDPITLELISYIDKTDDTALTGSPTACIMYNEEQSRNMSAWETGRYISSKCINRCFPIRLLETNRGGILQWLKYSTKVNNTEITVTAKIKNGSKALEFLIEYDMLDFGCEQTCVPRLDFAFKPLNGFTSFKNDIAGGFITREAINNDVPANSFIAASDIMLISDSGHGYRGCGGTLSACLARASYYPDKFSETFHHEMRLAVQPACTQSDFELARAKAMFINRVCAVSGRSGNGTLPMQGTFLSLHGSAAISVLKPCEEQNGIIVRLYALDGGGKISLSSGFTYAGYANLNETCENLQSAKDGSFTFHIKKGEVINILLTNKL